jgi:hypothetical protein
MRFATVVGAVLAMTGGAAAQGVQLPPDFNPGAVYGLTEADCTAQGGKSLRDGLGLTFCQLGEVISVHVCDGMRIVSLIRRADGALLLQDRDGSVLPVAEVPAASGYKVEGAGVALHSKGDEAVLTTTEGDAVCRRAR